MYSKASKEFKYLAVNPMQTSYGPIYRARLTKALGRKTIGLGSNYVVALQLASMIDEQIAQWIAKDEPIDIGSLKLIVDEQKEQEKEKQQKTLRVVSKDDLVVLWDNYVKFHTSIQAWEQSYILTTIKTVRSLVNQCPYQNIEHKQKIVEWIFDDSKRSVKTSKDRFKLIVAAIDWNSKQGNIPRKWGIEYRDLLNSISIKSEQKSLVVSEDDSRVEIFSVKEVYAILNALKNDTYSRFRGKHTQYYKYVYFCWLTGCRPSEAIALKWENVDLIKRRIKFCEGQVYASGKTVKKKGTKTVESRYFPINNELHDLLASIPHRTGYVFLRANGKPISQQALNRVWRYLLEQMNIPYRIPYQLRHTMISYHANNDYPIDKLAEIVGNSDEVIKEHYLKLDIERISLPDVIRDK